MDKKKKKKIVMAISVTAVLAITAYVVVKYSDKKSWIHKLCNSDEARKRIMDNYGHGMQASQKETEANIKGELSGTDAEVTYYPPTSDGRCGHYRVKAKDGTDLEAVNRKLESVAKSRGLEIDDEAYNIWDLVDRGDTKK